MSHCVRILAPMRLLSQLASAHRSADSFRLLLPISLFYLYPSVEKMALPAEALAKAGVPGRIRTCDLRIRSPLLYPAELRAHIKSERCSYLNKE